MIEEICRMCHYASWQLVSSVYVFLVQDVVVSTCGSLFGMCLLDYCWTVWVNLSSSKDFVELLTTELHISFSIQTFQITNQHWPTGLQCDRRSYMIDVEISGRTHPGQTHTHTHTFSSDWENSDRSQPDLTKALRKKSIKQQVHFSAEALKNMAAITLQELCWRGYEINSHWDSTATWDQSHSWLMWN